ncbi:hypothetical protein LZ32DRAFT_615992 [Colletotrichum eremochloae]|nr:hypothetical protein LZ32DRAFT_615992 [Colletotrichum eremochloae]
MPEKLKKRPRERRSSWSQLQVVRKPNKPRYDSHCDKRCAAYLGEKRKASSPRGGFERSIIRFFAKGVMSKPSKRVSPETKDKKRGRNGGHEDFPRPVEPRPQVVASAIPETATSTTNTSEAEAFEKDVVVDAYCKDDGYGRAGGRDDGHSGKQATKDSRCKHRRLPHPHYWFRSSQTDDYCQEPGPAGRVDSSWLGAFRDRLMGYWYSACSGRCKDQGSSVCGLEHREQCPRMPCPRFKAPGFRGHLEKNVREISAVLDFERFPPVAVSDGKRYEV